MVIKDNVTCYPPMAFDVSWEQIGYKLDISHRTRVGKRDDVTGLLRET